MLTNKQPYSNSFIFLTLPILTLLFLIPPSHQDCIRSLTPYKIHTDQIQVQQSSNSPSTLINSYAYQIPQKINTKTLNNKQIAIGVVGFGLDKNSIQFGYSIQSSFGNNNDVRFVVQFGDGWKYVRFRFVVSGDDGLLVGNFQVLTFNNVKDNNIFEVRQPIIKKNIAFNFMAKTKIFLSGVHLQQKSSLSASTLQNITATIKWIQALKKYSWSQKTIQKLRKILTTPSSPTIKLTNPKLINQNTLTFSIQTSQMQIKKLYISYIVYLEKVMDNYYHSVEGVVEVQSSGRYGFQGLKNTGVFFGISGLMVQAGQAGKIGVDIIEQFGVNGANDVFFVDIIDDKLSFTLGYIGIQHTQGSACQACPGSPIIYEQFCVSDCPDSYVPTVNSDGSFQCTKCNIQNLMIVGTDKTKCQCAPGHYLVSPTQSCIICPYDCQTCNGNKCLTCSKRSSRILNPISNRCECAPINQKGKSIFDDSISKINICRECNVRCRTCKGPQPYDCVTCQQNRTLYGGTCKCLENYVENSNGFCVCQMPYVIRNGRCQIEKGCGVNQKVVNVSNGKIVCVCENGYFRHQVSNRCLKQCQRNEQYNFDTEKCECRNGLIRNTTNQQCYSCNEKLNRIYNPETDQCDCIEGFELNSQNQCVECPPKTFYNPKTNNCDCIFNFYRNTKSGPCFKCTSQNDSTYCSNYGDKSAGTLGKWQ